MTFNGRIKIYSIKHFPTFTFTVKNFSTSHHSNVGSKWFPNKNNTLYKLAKCVKFIHSFIHAIHMVIISYGSSLIDKQCAGLIVCLHEIYGWRRFFLCLMCMFHAHRIRKWTIWIFFGYVRWKNSFKRMGKISWRAWRKRYVNKYIVFHVLLVSLYYTTWKFI